MATAKKSKKSFFKPCKHEKAFEEFTQQNYNYLEHKSDKFQNISQSEKLSILGYAHNRGRGGAMECIEKGKSKTDRFGIKAEKYCDEVKKTLCRKSRRFSFDVYSIDSCN